MALVVSTLPIFALLLFLGALHSLAIPMTTWTSFDLKVGTAPGELMPLPRESFVKTYSSPSAVISASVETTSETVSPTKLAQSPSFESLSPSAVFDAFTSIVYYIPDPPLPNNILIIFQLIFGATATLCLILGLASCISCLEHRRLRPYRWASHGPRGTRLSRLEIDVGEDLQILVVKTLTLSGGLPQSPSKSAIFTAKRKASPSKSVRWADELAVSFMDEDSNATGDPEKLLC